MKNITVFPRNNSGNFWKYFLLTGLLVLFIIPLVVSGETSGTADVTGNVLQYPVARFTANITSGTAPLAVNFTDLSADEPASWNWEFGDGTNSTDQNPTHTYAAGIYTVNLTVTNAAGNSTIMSVQYINALPVSTIPSQIQSLFVGGGGGGSSADSTAIGPGLQLPAMVNPLVPSGERDSQLAPVQGSPVSSTIDLSPYSGFMHTDSLCNQFAIIDREAAERSGATISVSGKTVEIIRPGFTLSIMAGTMTEADGVIRAGDIQSILLASTPIESYAEGVGLVTSSFITNLGSVQPNAGLTITLGDSTDPLVAEIFRLAVEQEGDEIQAIAYTLTVEKTNIADSTCICSYSLAGYSLTVKTVNIPATYSAMITMSVPAEWVNTHGGVNSMVIGRIGDDQKGTILETTFSGYDRNGNMEFVALSPKGLSIFALIATKGPLQAQMGPPASMMPGITGVSGIAILIILIVVFIAVSIIWNKQRPRPKKPGQQEKK